MPKFPSPIDAERFSQLAELPPPEELQRRITYLESRGDFEEAQRSRDLGAERDAIKATRPKGCDCLGRGWTFDCYAGGWQPKKLFCNACPEGIAAKVKHEQDRRELQIEKAGIPFHYCRFDLETFPTQNEDYALVKEWAEAGEDDPDFPPWLALTGATGRGKTGLGLAAMQERITGDTSARFINVAEMLSSIKAGFGQRQQAVESQIEDGAAADIVVLDDLDIARPTEWALETLYVLINGRYNRGATTIVTSMSPMPKLAEKWGGIGELLVWRIVELALLVHLDGPNLRVKRRSR